MNATIWDPVVQGLHTVVRGDSVSFFLYYRTKTGQQRRSKIGCTSLLTLKEARDYSKKLLAEVCLGGDPFGEMKAKRHALTIGELFQTLMQTHYSQEKYAESGYQVEVANLFSRHLKESIGPKKACELDAPTIFRWHAKLKKTPYVGNRAKAVLSKILSFAEQEGVIPAGSNPCCAVPNHPEKKRRRYANDVEILNIGAVLRKYEATHPKESAFIYLLMMTGSRPSALERATFEDLSLVSEGAIMSVAGKRGQDEIFIPTKALKLISANGNAGILVGKFPRLFWQRVREEAGCPDLWARDLRRTFGTTGLSIGVTRGTISELLNHKSEQTTKIYSLLKPAAKIEAAQTIAEELDRLLGWGPSEERKFVP